jgi:hypothetical protein
MTLFEIGECEGFKRKKMAQSHRWKKEYNGDQLEIWLSGLGPEEKVLKYRQLLHLQNFSRS